MRCIKDLSGHTCLLFSTVERCQKENAPIEIAYDLYKAKAINCAFTPFSSSTFQHYWNMSVSKNKMRKLSHSISDGQKIENEGTPLNDTSYEKPVQPESDHTEMLQKLKLKFHIEISLSAGSYLELYLLAPNENYPQKHG